MSQERIGLIGGLALRAGLFYYEQLYRRHESLGKPLDLVLVHADIRIVLAHVGAGDEVALGQYLGALANDLFGVGARLVAISAVAPHLAIDHISRIARGPVINMLDAISHKVAGDDVGPLAIFGNRAVVESNAFGAVPATKIVRMSAPLMNEVHEIYTDIALNAKRGTQAETARLEAIARTLIERSGAEIILLAGTDLSSFYADRPADYPVLDAAQLHLDEIMKRLAIPVDAR